MTMRSNQRKAESARPPSELTQARAFRTRTAVLQAAAKLFAQRGFASVTILDIAEGAGITKGAVYFHFSNKEALAVELANAFYAAAPEVTAALDDLESSALETLRDLVARTALQLRDDVIAQAAVRLQTERSDIDAELPPPFLDFIEATTLLLTRARDNGELAPDVDPAVLGRTMVAAFFGVQHVSWVLHARADLVERTEELFDLLLPGGPDSADGPPRG